jgi:nitroreductase
MEPITEAMELFRHQRQVRAFADRPVDDDLVRQVLQAGVHGPSGSNTTPWRFIVVRDQGVKDQLSPLYDEAFKATYGDAPPPRGADRQPLSQVPVLIVVCVRTPGSGRAGFQTGASVYPSVQNIMLAARALGLGTGITTLHRRRLEEVHGVLGIPEGWDSAAIILLGWPDRAYGPNRRPPLERFVSQDRWTEPPQD